MLLLLLMISIVMISTTTASAFRKKTTEFGKNGAMGLDWKLKAGMNTDRINSFTKAL
jgi:hypothetical protein